MWTRNASTHVRNEAIKCECHLSCSFSAQSKIADHGTNARFPSVTGVARRVATKSRKGKCGGSQRCTNKIGRDRNVRAIFTESSDRSIAPSEYSQPNRRPCFPRRL